MLILFQQFTYEPHISPVCLEFYKYASEKYPSNGSEAFVAGWGLTKVSLNKNLFKFTASISFEKSLEWWKAQWYFTKSSNANSGFAYLQGKSSRRIQKFCEFWQDLCWVSYIIILLMCLKSWINFKICWWYRSLSRYKHI